MRTIFRRVLSVTVVISAAIACNTITGVNDYATKTCQDCSLQQCTDIFTTCAKDPGCNAFIGCLSTTCAQDSDEGRACVSKCGNAPASKGNANVQNAIFCMLGRCRTYCFHTDLPEPGDGGFDVPPPDGLPDVPPGDVVDSIVEDSSGDASPAPVVTVPGCLATRGPAMVRASASGTDWCIDTTEVTNAQYAAFWAATAKGTLTSGQSADCTWNTSYTPSTLWNADGPTTDPSLPVTYVDWCDASAYCAWAGKHLCGRVGGGTVASTELGDKNKDMWYSSCSGGGLANYPYGATYDSAKCNDSGSTPSAGLEKAVTSCESIVYAKLLDMSGNAAEWEDACGGSGASGNCFVRGGAFATDVPSDLACAGIAPLAGFKRNAMQMGVGFRCCAN